MRGKVGRTAKRSVTADSDDAVDTELAAGLNCLLHTLLRLELGAAVGIEHRTALVDYIGYVAQTKGLDVAADKTRVSSENSYDLNAACNSGSYDRSDSGIHSGRVAAGGKNSYCFKFLFHICHLVVGIYLFLSHYFNTFF